MSQTVIIQGQSQFVGMTYLVGYSSQFIPKEFFLNFSYKLIKTPAITSSYAVSYVAKDDQTSRMLAHIKDIDLGDPQYVFECGESIHRFG